MVSRDIDDAKIFIVHRSLVRTADLDYITARFAHFNAVQHLFWWSCLQSVEKYLKAILLVNNKNCSNHGHDIIRIFDDVIVLIPKIKKLELNLNIIFNDNVLRSNQKIELRTFIQKISENGNADSHYGLASTDIDYGDLLYMDQLAFQLRRAILPMNRPTDESKITFAQWFDENPGKIYSQNGEIWKILKDENHSLHKYAKSLNIAFLPNSIWERTSLKAFSTNSPVWIMLQEADEKKNDGKDLKIELLQWLLNSWKLSPRDKKEIENELRRIKYL